MCPPAKVNGVWPFNDAWLRTSVVVGQTSGATQRCLNPGFSERIRNSRRTRVGRGRSSDAGSHAGGTTTVVPRARVHASDRVEDLGGRGQLGRDLDENPRYVASGDRGAGGSLPGDRLHVDRTPLNYAPLSALCLLIRSSSSGRGNTMVELCSAPMSVSVCR